MVTKMEKPACVGRAVPVVDVAAGKIDTEHNPSLRVRQVDRLVRLYAVNASMAEAIAPLVFLEAMR